MKILITGAASGIGCLTGLTLAKRGHFVYLACHNNNQKEKLLEKVKDSKVRVIKIDVTNKEDINKVLDLNIDCLINNAAVGQGGSILEANMDKVRKSFEINVFSNVKLTNIVLKQMLKKNSGRIINMSSIAAMIPAPFIGIYSATKASITNITKSLRGEIKLINKNIDVVLIEPGLYHTGFNNILLDSKYNNGKYFNKVKNKIYNIEHVLLKIGEKKQLDSIIVKIVRATEDKKPRSVYRAPLYQSLLAKLYCLFK